MHVHVVTVLECTRLMRCACLSGAGPTVCHLSLWQPRALQGPINGGAVQPAGPANRGALFPRLSTRFLSFFQKRVV